MTIKQTNQHITGGSGVSRRASFLTLGGAALAATLAQPRAADARKKRKKTRKNTRKKCNQVCEQQMSRMCQQQGEQCRTRAISVCAGSVEPETCEAFFLPICDALGQCNAEPLLEYAIVLS